MDTFFLSPSTSLYPIGSLGAHEERVGSLALNNERLVLIKLRVSAALRNQSLFMTRGSER